MNDEQDFGQEDERLTEAERTAFAALEREHEPGRLLEERTVKALRERGLLASTESRLASRPDSHTTWRVGLGGAWKLAAAIAAAILLFGSGISVGQMIGARQTTVAVEAALGSPELRDAMRVQRAGTDYVAALAALAERSASDDSAAAAQGVEVALTALWAAANEIVRLAPEDPLAARILVEFERARLQEQTDGPAHELVIWN